ncbi:ribonucleotide reductase beta subunit family protein with ferritin-like domain [Bradyrhizobium sp. USDA 377]
MPAWLEVLLNLSGFAGFVALATRGASRGEASATDPIHTDER